MQESTIWRGRTYSSFACWLCTAISLISPAESAKAQGSRDDYRRAAELRENVKQTVFRDRVEPQWIEESRFWYRVAIARQQHRFILVDAAHGIRKPLFDHQRLAKTLTDKLGFAVNAAALPLSNVKVEPNLKYLQFHVQGLRLRCDLSTYRLQDTNPAEGDQDTLPANAKIQPASRTTGEEMELTFSNQSKQSVRLFWRDFDGKRVAYAKLAAGSKHRQHTFAGHSWEVADLQGRPLVGFVASLHSSQAIIAPGLRPLEPKAAPTEDPHRSPDGRWRVRFRQHNVVLEAIERRQGEPEEIMLTRDGVEDDAYAGPVHWSPNSKQLVVLKVKSPQKHPVHTIEAAPQDQLQPKLHTWNYLKPGDKIAHPRPRLFDVDSRQNIPVADELFPHPWSIGELRWEDDSQRFTFLYNERGHQTLRVIAVDASGESSVVIDETSSTFVDYHAKLYFHRLEATGEILWMSERDGWNHLWLYDAAGEVKHQVTQGAWVVRRVEHVDEQRRQVWFLAGGVRPEQDPYYLHLCRVNFDGSDLAVLTEGDGTHEVSFSPDRQWFLDRWSRVDQPPITELRRSTDGKQICLLETADHEALLATGWTTPEPFVAPGRDGQTKIYGVIVRPSNFDPNQRYPIVEQIYAGPHGAHVPKGFGLMVGQHAMSELGFILVQIDGMGTNGRSKRFHDVCWRNLADAGFPDRIAWIREAAKTRPWMDLDRVGVFGGSAGGQNAMRALIDHHDFYSVAVADCGCHDNRMDKIWWNELWMGHPVGPHYEASSNAVHAHRLQGKLMLIVGELDRNVDPASTMQVVAALQQADKDFEHVIIAGRGHGAAETPYGSRRRSDFLVRHLHGCEPRWER